MVCYGKVHRGYEYPILQFAVITETDILGEKKRKNVIVPMKEKNSELYRFECW